MQYLCSFSLNDVEFSLEVQWVPIVWPAGAACTLVPVRPTPQLPTTLSSPPTLCHLVERAPQLFSVELGWHRQGLVGGRIYSRLADVLPHVPFDILLLLQQEARLLFVEAASNTDITSAQLSSRALWPTVSLPLNLIVSPHWQLDVAAARMVQCADATTWKTQMPFLVQGGVVHYACSFPTSFVQQESAHCRSLLVLTRDLLTDRWPEHATVVTYTQIEKLHLEPYFPPDMLCQASLRGMPFAAQLELLRSYVRDADLVQQEPLLALWCGGIWEQVWFEEPPSSCLAHVRSITASWRWVIERCVCSLTHAKALLYATLLNIAPGYLSSPYLSAVMQLSLIRYMADAVALPAPRHVTHWGHLSRHAHAAYLRQAGILHRLQVCTGLTQPLFFRISSWEEAQAHRRSCERRGRKRGREENDDAANVARPEEGKTACAFFARQKPPTPDCPATCPVCLRDVHQHLVLLKCGHTLCLSCTQRCLRDSPQCPQCRAALRVPSSCYLIASDDRSADMRAIYGHKLATLHRILTTTVKPHARVVLLCQLPPLLLRRLVAILRQARLPCSRATSRIELQRFLAAPLSVTSKATGAPPAPRVLLLTMDEMRGLEFPGVHHVVLLHGMLEPLEIERAFPHRPLHCHHMPLRNTIEQLLL